MKKTMQAIRMVAGLVFMVSAVVLCVLMAHWFMTAVGYAMGLIVAVTLPAIRLDTLSRTNWKNLMDGKEVVFPKLMKTPKGQLIGASIMKDYVSCPAFSGLKGIVTTYFKWVSTIVRDEHDEWADGVERETIMSKAELAGAWSGITIAWRPGCEKADKVILDMDKGLKMAARWQSGQMAKDKEQWLFKTVNQIEEKTAKAASAPKVSENPFDALEKIDRRRLKRVPSNVKVRTLSDFACGVLRDAMAELA